MANVAYPKALNAYLQGLINLASTVRALLVDTADESYNAADEFLSDITPAAIVATSPALTGKTFGDLGPGVFDADDTTFAGVSGDGTEAVVLFVDTGNPATSRLLWWLDGVVVPNGNDILCQWNAAGIGQI